MSRDRPENIWYIHLTKQHEKAPRDKHKLNTKDYIPVYLCDLTLVPDKILQGETISVWASKVF